MNATQSAIDDGKRSGRCYIQLNGGEIGIGVDYTMPYRKKPCLVVIEGNKETKYASFNDAFAADEFMDKLCLMMGVKREVRG